MSYVTLGPGRGVRVPDDAEDLHDEARGAAAVLSSGGTQLTVSAIVTRGLELALAELRQRHNGGRPFEPCESLGRGCGHEQLARILPGGDIVARPQRPRRRRG